MTLLKRRFTVLTSLQGPCDVVVMSFVGWAKIKKRSLKLVSSIIHMKACDTIFVGNVRESQGISKKKIILKSRGIFSFPTEIFCSIALGKILVCCFEKYFCCVHYNINYA